MSNDVPPTSSFPITDPDIIARLDSLSPEEMERLSSILEDSLKELRKERDGERESSESWSRLPNPS
jgi:hypothetical protein